MDSRSILVIALLWLIVVAVVLLLFVWPRYRRRKLDATPFPHEWLLLLRENLTIYRGMWPDQQAQLRRLIMRFLADKKFVGCAGQVIDDNVRITIAAHASLLLLNRPTNEYHDLNYILVYPTDFLVRREERDESGLVSEGAHALSGESWDNGKVILAWESVVAGIRNFGDGDNVVLHEFAHQLDHESGITNGAPILGQNQSYDTWSSVLADEYAALCQACDENRQTLIDPYGATNPAEFFAVVTETFYERAHELAHHHPALFEQLQAYFRVDPREWQPNPYQES